MILLARRAWRGFRRCIVAGSGDFNGDGLTDLYVYHADGKVRAEGIDSDYVALARGDGSFEKVVLSGDGITGSSMDEYKAMATADFTGDSLADVLLAKVDSKGRIVSTSGVLLVSRGTGRFTNRTISIRGASSSMEHVVASVGDFNGDGVADIYTHVGDDQQQVTGSGTEDYLRISSYGYPDLLTSITNGVALSSSIAYKPLTDSSAYERGAGAIYPAAEITTARYVVSQGRADDGVGGVNTQSYSYEALRAHVAGEGSLGFAKVIATDDATGIVTTSVYSQDYAGHVQGMLTQSTVATSGGVVLEWKDISWQAVTLETSDGTGRHLRLSPQTTVTRRDLNGVELAVVTESTRYDAYGFPLEQAITTSLGGASIGKTTVNSYAHDVTNGNWLMGRLLQSTVTHSETGKASIVRTSRFTYDATTGLLASETIEPDDALFQTKSYRRSEFGAVTEITENWGSADSDGIEATSRTTRFEYDSKARYRVSETNPLGHSESKTHDAVTGLVTSSTGPNGITTGWSHDAFGRVTLETRAANREEPTTTATAREFCGGSVWCPTHGALRITTTTSGAPPTVAYQDKLYRTIATATQGFDGRWVFVVTDHDAKGRVEKRSEPYFEGASAAHWTTITYDVLVQ